MDRFENEYRTEFIKEIFEQMRSNPELAGSYELDERGITWRLFDSLPPVEMGWNYIGLQRYIFGKIPDSLMHWHPGDEEMYENICALGTKGNVTVIRKSWLGEALLYAGPASDCPYTRKRLFGKYYYLYAKE